MRPRAESPNAIEVRGISKRFGSFTALHDVTFSVQRGEVFGYVGPNGSGKTTTIRALLDLVRADSGELRVLGSDPRRSSAQERRRVGYLPGELALWPRMSGRRVLEELGRLRALDDMSRAEELAERFRIDLDRRVGDLSKGNRQKLGVIQAFMHDPDLVILDEPSSGLDPLMQLELQALIREHAESGRTVFVSSHVMTEIERMAHRVAIIHDGRIRVVDSITGLEAAQPQLLRASCPDGLDPATLALPLGVRLSPDPAPAATISLLVDDPACLPAALRLLADLGATSLDANHGDLEAVFLATLMRAPGAQA